MIQSTLREHQKKMKHVNIQPWSYLPLLLLAMSALFLVGLEWKTAGWVVWSAGILSLFPAKRMFKLHIGLIYISLGLLGLVPIITDVTNANFLRMGSVLALALIIPYYIDHHILKTEIIRYQFHHGRIWYKKEVFYIFFTALIAYLLLPFYFNSTGAHLNWTVENNSESIFRLFIGTNGLGIWDELFFVSTVLGILRYYLPFWQANMLQSVLFTSFLFDLGFTGWAPWVLYPFALLQGYIFKKTDSLFYVITIHLTLDFVLFLALINAHHPQLIDIFITG